MLEKNIKTRHKIYFGKSTGEMNFILDFMSDEKH